jgi:hypothetical protein
MTHTPNVYAKPIGASTGSLVKTITINYIENVNYFFERHAEAGLLINPCNTCALRNVGYLAVPE